MINRVAIFIITFFLLMGYASVPMAFGAGDDLDAAIRELSDYLNKRIPKGTKAVFLNVKSDWPAFSEYILDCLQENAVNDGVFTVVDRQQLDAIRSELNFQWSGEVNDKSAQEIGKMLGAQTIVSGLVTTVRSEYRIQVRAIAVQTAAVQGLTTKNISNKGPIVTALTTAPAASPQPGSNNATAYFNRGQEYLQNKDYDRAIAEFNQALRLDPNYPLSYSSRGTAYTLKGEYDRAIVDITQAIRLLPNNADVYAMRGMLYNLKKDNERAIADFEAALRIDPNNDIAKQWIEQLRQAQGGNTTVPASGSYKVGDTGPAGGLIFYDKGNNNGGWRYLEAAPADINRQLQATSEQIKTEDWSERAVGKGKSNTEAIMKEAANRGGGFGWAAQACDAYTLNGFRDWFLPSRDELHYMYGNLHLNGLGNFKNERYWSSTAQNSYYIWWEDFSTGSQENNSHGNTFRVRPIRQF